MKIDKYNFIEFQPKGLKYSPMISIGKTNRIGLSSSLISKNSLEDKKAAIIFFDKESNAIGFKFLADKNEKTLPINHLSAGGAYINAKSFFGFYDIDVESVTGRYSPREVSMVDGSKLFVIEIPFGMG